MIETFKYILHYSISMTEAVIIQQPTIVRRYTVAVGTAITKGALFKLSNTAANTAIISSSVYDVFAGIAVTDKTATDTQTSHGFAQDGVYDIMMATGSTCKAGDLMIISGADAIARLKDHATQGTAGSCVYVSGMVVGMALQDGTSATACCVDIGRKH